MPNAHPISLLAMSALVLAGVARGQAVQSAPLNLTDVISLPAQTIAFNSASELQLPSLPAKPGHTLALRLRAVSRTEQPAGCNFNAAIAINGTGLGRYTAGGGERLIGRAPMFTFVEGHKGAFQIFAGDTLMVLFAPDIDAGDRMTTDGCGATFAFDISDVARGVDGNTLTIRNIRKRSHLGKNMDLIVQDIEIGWVDKALLPKPPNRVPERGQVETSVTQGPLRLSAGRRGGFALASGAAELLVETGIGVQPKAVSELIVADEPDAAAKVTVSVESAGAEGLRIEAVWSGFRLVRKLELRDGLLHWRECWTNTGTAVAGLPFRHRVFLRSETARFRLGGDADVGAVAGSPQNPTVFLQSGRASGHGFGITAESDWLRLLMGLRADGGVGELFSDCLALPPGASIDFALTVSTVRDGGGYWSFINAVRQRWGVNGTCVPRPVFWSYARAPEIPDREEQLRQSLGHLGPIVLALGPWVRLSYDVSEVRRGRYPKLANGEPPTPGGTPDLDVGAFVSFAHRELHWTEDKRRVDMIHRVCPNVQVIQLMHPAMEVAYKPLAERWPYAADAITALDGQPFESSHYSRAHLGDCVQKGWGVLYYVPRAGSAYLSALLRDVRRSLDDCGCDGVYFDEFSWAGTRRDYSRYDYGRWDGYSADLDEQGNVVRFKSDNAAEAEVAQLEIVREVASRGKLFLGNGTGTLRSVSSLPIARFVEGGNGYGRWAGAHLATVPLILGNFGDKTTVRGVFDAVKSCLSNGCIYSPSSVNLVLDDPNNFVCKLYPITICRIAPGTVVGEERLITTVTGQYAWPGRDCRLKLYQYDKNGALVGVSAPRTIEDTRSLEVTVPDGGLVIAEICQRQPPIDGGDK